jgi:hypothetical protein
VHPITLTAIDLFDMLGLPRLDYGPEEWAQCFADMARDGIEMVCVQMSVLRDKACYPSQVIPNQIAYDGLGTVFELAERHGMQVILGLADVTYFRQFQDHHGWWDPKEDLQINLRVAPELNALYGHHPALWGWYIPHETGDRIHRGDVMHVLTRLPRFLKELRPDLPIAHGPWFTSRLTVGDDATTPTQFADEWDAMLSEIEGIDVYAIQDGTAPDDEMADWYAAAAPVFAAHGAELWAVNEAFPREERTADVNRAVPWERLLRRMRITSGYVKQHAVFDYPHYMNPRSPVAGAAALNAGYRRWLDERANEDQP